MDRFDVEFNDIDPETGRPFSAGHTDGVWMISIVYFLIALVSAGAAIHKIKTGSAGEFVMPVSAVVNALIFALPIYFLFKRSAKAIYVIGFITFLAVLSGAVSLFSGMANKFVLLGVASLQLYAFIYVVGLKKDGLLS